MKYILVVMLLTMSAFVWADPDNATGTNCSGDQVATDRSPGKDSPAPAPKPVAPTAGGATKVD